MIEMKTTKLTPIMFALLLGSVIPALGKTEADKKNQEEYQNLTIIRKSQKDLEKAMAESLAASEKELKEKLKAGHMNNDEYEKALKEYNKKLQNLQSSGSNWIPPIAPYGTGISPKIRIQGEDLPYNAPYSIYMGDRENSSLSISKNLEEVTFATDFKYDVKQGASRISFSVNGTMKSGELQIVLMKPDKTPFQEMKISPLADVNWNQQFKWEEDESDEYLGTWLISISATKASGTYRIQVNSR